MTLLHHASTYIEKSVQLSSADPESTRVVIRRKLPQQTQFITYNSKLGVTLTYNTEISKISARIINALGTRGSALTKKASIAGGDKTLEFHGIVSILANRPDEKEEEKPVHEPTKTTKTTKNKKKSKKSRRKH